VFRLGFGLRLGFSLVFRFKLEFSLGIVLRLGLEFFRDRDRVKIMARFGVMVVVRIKVPYCYS
jgi:hypothetical protein